MTVDSYHAGDVNPADDNIAQRDYVITSAQPTVNYQLSTVNCFTGDHWSIGLSAGATIDLVGGLALEVGVRGGYINTRPIKYTMDNYHNWFEGRYKYYQFKVTDLNVSLVYRFR